MGDKLVDELGTTKFLRNISELVIVSNIYYMLENIILKIIY